MWVEVHARRDEVQKLWNTVLDDRREQDAVNVPRVYCV